GRLSIPRSAPTIAVVGEKVIFAGGLGPGSRELRQAAVDIYDAELDTWMTARLAQPAWNQAVVTTGTTVLFIGGDRLASDTVDIYDAQQESWQPAFLSQPRSHIAAASVGTQ